MLNREQLAWLECALDENSSGEDAGTLSGKTYAEMAEVFNRKTGATLSAEGLRYHVRNLGKKGLSRGRRPYRTEEHLWIGRVGHLLLAITRWSPNRVHLLMQVNSRSVYPPVSSVSFYKLLTAIKPVPSRLFDHPPGHVLERYKLRLHQICIVDTNDEPIGMWLVGFEAYTGFCHAQWFEFRYKRQHAKPGRPRKIPTAEDTPLARHQPSSQILLPDELLAKFCRKCQSRFFLPLTHFLIPYGYSSMGLAGKLDFCATVPSIVIDRLPGSVFKVPATWDSDAVERLRRRTLLWVNRHNRFLAQERIAKEWATISSKLTKPKRGPKKAAWGHDKRRTRWEDDQALNEFYHHNPHYPGSLARIDGHVKLLRL